MKKVPSSVAAAAFAVATIGASQAVPLPATATETVEDALLFELFDRMLV